MPGGATLRAQAAALVVAAALLAGACGGATPAATDGSAVVEPTPAPGNGDSGAETALEQAARQSFSDFLSSADEGYYDALSRDCRERLGFAAVENYLIGRRTRAERGAGINLADISVSEVVIEDFTGQAAEVSLVVAGTSETFRESLPQRWVFEENAWRLADCSDIRQSSNDLTGRGTDRNAPLVRGDVVDIAGWLVALSQVDTDFESTMSPGEVVPAAEGNQLVSAQLLVTYNGAEPAVVIGDHMAFAIVSNSAMYGDEAGCVSNEYDDLFYDPSMEATPGEDLPRALICREVPSSDLGGLLLRLTHVPTSTEYWFDLSQS